MEMDSLHTADHTETAEPRPSSERPTYKDAQVWRELEAETGFASCADYMEFFEDVRPDFKKRLEQFRDMPWSGSEKNLIAIYDLSKQNNLEVSLSLRRQCYSGTELIQNLREPPHNVSAQLVLWSCSDPFLNREMVDALILGLKLDPQLLKDYVDMPRRYLHPRNKGFRTSQIKSLVGNNTIATLSQNFMPEAANPVPVLLVAFETDHLFHDGLEDILAGGDKGKPPIYRSAPEEAKPRGVMVSDEPETRGQMYAKAVENFIMQARPAKPSTAFLVLAAMSPLLYVEAYRVREASNKARWTYCAVTEDKIRGWNRSGLEHIGQRNLDRERHVLRRTLEEAEDHVSQIFSYLGSEFDTDWFEEPSYLSIKADWGSLMDEAHRLESEVKDYMQLQVGNLSLEESRRSIELSNIQIRESKSVKIFTVLAFVYVPLNLATSIFGMNIQQLNQSGQNIWVFFVTAVVALVVTGGSWACSNSAYKAMVWYKEWATHSRVSYEQGKKRDFSVVIRMSMLVWLVRNGHSTWMWKTGACIAILLNSKVVGERPNVWPSLPPACDYVERFSQEDDAAGRFFRVPLIDDLHWSVLFGPKGRYLWEFPETMRDFPRADRYSFVGESVE